MKQILFDESHDEAVSIEDTEVSGFFNLAKDLKKLGYDVKRTETMFDAELEAADVLVVAFPNREFNQEERNKIRDFVNKGGGLLLLGEWANLKGVAECLNGLSLQFGVEFRNDRVTDFDDRYARDEKTMESVLGAGEMPYFVKLEDIMEHPVTEGVKSIGYLAGCTLETENESALVWADETSFADVRIDKFQQISEKSGPFIVVAAKLEGKGRIVFSGDSSTLSNRFIESEDNRKFGMQIFQWLVKDR